jgi:hypothetical protein
MNRVEFTDPEEVAAQVNAWAWLIGNMSLDSGLTEKLCHGLYCIGHMIAQNVETTIKDLQDEIYKLREAKGGSGEA